jgi:beta-N-acetylhexosaminidase
MSLGPLMVDVAGTELTAEERTYLQHPLVGGVILFSRNYHDREQVTELVRQIKALRSPPLLLAVDQEGGRVQRFREGFSALPPLLKLGQQFNVNARAARRLASLHGWLMASEILDLGIDISFAPVVDIDYGVSEVIGDRAFHSRADVVCSMALAYMQGMHRAGMAATAKHFPGHGAVAIDSHLALPVDQRSYSELSDDLLPYQTLIENQLEGVMVAHIRYPKIDPDIASLSPFWLNTQLRDTFRFNGAIFSDDLTMGGAQAAGTVPERTRLALDAGADVALICNNPAAAIAAIDALSKDTSRYVSAVGHTRIAAMRSRRHNPELIYGSDTWLQARNDLEKGLQPPEFTLQG